jgi:hypothetical protein
MPWEREGDGGKLFKYQYHPHGDSNQPLRNAPSALNTVIVPNVTLPEVRLHHPEPGEIEVGHFFLIFLIIDRISMNNSTSMVKTNGIFD